MADGSEIDRSDLTKNSGRVRLLDVPAIVRRAPRSFRPRSRWVEPGTWNAARVRSALLDWNAEFGRPPLSYEWTPGPRSASGAPNSEGIHRWRTEHPRWPSKSTVARYFGSWGEALEDAGLPVRRLLFEASLEERVLTARRLVASGLSRSEIADGIGVKPATVDSYLRAGNCRGCGAIVVQSSSGLCRQCGHLRSSWSREQILEAINHWVREEGRPPSSAEWTLANPRWREEFPRWPTKAIVVATFGKWNYGLREAGCETRGRTWSREEIVEALQDWTRSHGGRPPAYGDFRRAGTEHPGATVVADRFGSWRQALIEAGLAPRYRRWTKEDALAKIRRWSRSHRGDVPSATHASEELPPYSVVLRLFGSWGTAMEDAGLQPQLRRWTQAEIIGAMQRHQADHGELPTQADWTPAPPGCPSPNAVASHFGSWRRALEMAATRSY